jgi:hypothetical protein
MTEFLNARPILRGDLREEWTATIEQLRQLLQGHVSGIIAQLHNSVPVATQSEELPDHASAFKQQFDAFLRRLDVEWASERDSNPMGADEGKLILMNALNDVLSFRGQIVSGLERTSRALDEVAVDLRRLQRHQLYLDGGKSFRAFFELGDSMITKLKTISDLIEEETSIG